MGISELLGLKDKETDPKKKEFHKRIQKEAGRIAFLAMRLKLKERDIRNLEKLYDQYFNKWPDIQAQERARLRIEKLRRII